ncbi:SURF1 family protein [Pseudonocardia sp. N23]|uniref:SURF1 family cytochrome oxidase biogenesis protein n=1 Tax=Pseudonocardia sp. N23 TaxID=1987376 RepID=UPI000BFDE225|nr:SURF1 family cytochrome oxidase biogenesis protein [Pseudonocardia sp. N23]GAY11236.1 cytochrome oxidase biogenesis protein Surf1, facilitates heme A insertion [Pseudonocardia sp. N23]
MRFLLRPQWIALVVAVVGFAVACYVYLAPWQFGRESQRDEQQKQIDNAATTAAVPFGTLVPGDAVDAGAEWRRVSVTGTFLPQDETVVRLRVVDGKPAVEVMTPMRTADGRVVVVDRGTVRALDGQTVPDFPPAPQGEVTVDGRLRVDETDPQARPAFEAAGHRQMYAADSRTVAAAAGTPMVVGYVAQQSGPGVLDPLAIEAGEGAAPFSNFSYALQWLTFGAIAIIALGYFVRLEILQRRGRRDRASERTALRDALSGRDDTPDHT